MFTSLIKSLLVILIINLTSGLTDNWIHLNLDNVVYSSSSIITVSKIQCVMLASQSPTVTSFSYHRNSKYCYFYTEVPGIHLLPLPVDLVGAKTYKKLEIPGLLDTTNEVPTTTTEPSTTTEALTTTEAPTTTVALTTTTAYQSTVPPLTGADLCATKSGYDYDSNSNGCYRIYITLAFISSANQTCIDDGGYLMRLNTPAKKTWLEDNMITGSLWLGGQKDSNGDWFWDNGDPINLSDFDDILSLDLPTFDCIRFTKVPYFSLTMDTTTCLVTLAIACEIPV